MDDDHDHYTDREEHDSNAEDVEKEELLTLHVQEIQGSSVMPGMMTSSPSFSHLVTEPETSQTTGQSESALKPSIMESIKVCGVYSGPTYGVHHLQQSSIQNQTKTTAAALTKDQTSKTREREREREREKEREKRNENAKTKAKNRLCYK